MNQALDYYQIHGSYNFMQANKFQGFFKDNLHLSRTKIYVINWHSLNPLLITQLGKTRHEVIYDFYFFSQR